MEIGIFVIGIISPHARVVTSRGRGNNCIRCLQNELSGFLWAEAPTRSWSFLRWYHIYLELEIRRVQCRRCEKVKQWSSTPSQTIRTYQAFCLLHRQAV